MSGSGLPPVGVVHGFDSNFHGERVACGRLRAIDATPPFTSMKRVSVVIPYFRRLGNLALALNALAEQDLPRAEFEVVIGTLEHSVELTSLLNQFDARLQIRCVCAAEPWNVARARNLALRAVEGDIVQLLDADMLLPRGYLRRLVQRFTTRAQVVVGQMLNYDEGVDVGGYSDHDFDFYRQSFLMREDRPALPTDIRWTIERPLPWALCWTASIALSRHDLEQSNLFFDTRFKGWGVEDTEWAFRLAQANLPIVFADDLWAIHLPHPRNVASNHHDEAANFDRFLRKWPCFDVEVVAAFGDVGGNRRYRELLLEAERVSGAKGCFGVVEYPAADGAALAIGAVRGDDGELANPEFGTTLLQGTGWKLLPVFGYRLPYDTGSIARAEVLPTLRRVPDDLQEIVRREAQRVSRAPIHVH
jgi:glycosyltransferase involved in cell wall biosynthesis